MSHLRKDKGNEDDLTILAPQDLNITIYFFFFAAEVVFSEQLACVWESQMKRNQHAIINPAINIILRSGFGGQGMFPLARFDGKFMFIILNEITKSKERSLSFKWSSLILGCTITQTLCYGMDILIVKIFYWSIHSLSNNRIKLACY
jgi:hypothetical protein